MSEQAAHDHERREIAIGLVSGIEPTIHDGTDPSAAAGALVLAAVLLGVHHDLGDVRELIAGDIQRDLEALRSGEWRFDKGDHNGR